MTHKEIFEALENAIAHLQERSGDEVSELHLDTTLINGVEGFDSLRGLELTVAMSQFFEIPDNMSLCTSKDGNRALTVAEIIDKLSTMNHKTMEE